MLANSRDKLNNTISLNADNPSILNKIIMQRQSRLADIGNITSIESIQPSTRSLVSALQNSKSGFIFECKKKSPSRGLLSKNYDAAKIAVQYAPFATAISVLTEPDFFAGSLKDLSQVSEAVALPVLCKDFVINTQQLYQARASGADVILLMLSVITDQFWIECNDIATHLGLDVITEVHDHSELKRAIRLPAKIIGINNRNLHTLKTNISITESMVGEIPSDRLIISESGISSHQQLLRLAPLVDGFLIGSSMMQSESLALALRRLIFGEVKICGITRRLDADLSWQLGASFGGMIFTPISSRCISMEQAKLICENQEMPMVGVFKDQTPQEIIPYAKTLHLKAIQLHGAETTDEIKELRLNINADCEIWKAIICSETDADYPTIEQAYEIKETLLHQGVDRVLIDTPKDSAVHNLKYKNFSFDNKAFIAGGLSIDKAYELRQKSRETQQTLTLSGIDICSSLETSPGVKDADKLKMLFNKLAPATR